MVELDNSYDTDRISYGLWKILCVRAAIRVLICYQKNVDTVTPLKERLESVIWQGSLMKGTDGDLLVIDGDDSATADTPLGECLRVFEWRNDRLERIERPGWSE